ncbi:hypothetical protein HYZ97_01275 [Candidatus Pacearchaeota archaeon]|nr:hypothetical protein [Candidatus Pacearchaeota archaeon]
MGRRKILRIPKIVSLKCPSCSAVSRRKVPDNSPMYFDCDKCTTRIQAPITACCIICAFTGKKCIPSLKMEAHAKGLNLR